MRKNTTILDVALDAGLSTATVSRALNEPHLVKEATLARVRASVAKLDYKPNIGAQLLAKGATGKTICFMLANRPFVHSVHGQVLQGAAIEAEARNAYVLYVTCSYSPDDMPSDIDLPRILATRGLIDGIIAAGTNYANIVPLLEDIGLPYVLFGTNMIADDKALVPTAVYTDDEGGGYQATRHLIDLGHKTLWFIGDISLPWYRRRYVGYMRAMTEAGLKYELPIGTKHGSEMEMGFKATNELCMSGAEFTALFVAGDEGAVGAISALRQHGKSVPGDISVVGFNDEECARMSEPRLTTISVPKQKVGAECVRMLQKLIENPGKKVKPIILPAELVIRESTQEEKSIV